MCNHLVVIRVINIKICHVPWPVVLDVVFLNLLHVVVRLRVVHALSVLPREITNQAHRRERDDCKPVSWAGHDDGQCVDVFGAEVQLWRDKGVYGQEDEPNGHTAGDSDDSILGPDVGDQRCLREHRHQTCSVHGGTPDPVASSGAVPKRRIVPVDQNRAVVQDQGVVEAIADPRPEVVSAEEYTLLGKLIKLWVAIQ